MESSQTPSFLRNKFAKLGEMLLILEPKIELQDPPTKGSHVAFSLIRER